jgi:hypothetical protein
MAKSSSFGFTNTTTGANDVDQIALGLTTNYALTSDQANNVVLNNKTAPIDQEEIVTVRSGSIDIKSKANIVYPAPVKTGMEYGVRLDEVLSTTDSNDPSYRVDEPIICSITFRHPKSGNITNAIVAQVFQRAISTLMKADGTWRFADLMRSAERPIVD